MQIFDDVDGLAPQLDHADRLITELVTRIDTLEAELAAWRAANPSGEPVA
jgi:hypothetical protein